MSEVKMSESEKRLLTLLPVSGARIDTATLTKQFYRGRKVPPNGRIAIGNLLRALVRKTKRQELKVMRTKRAGPYATEAWLRRKP